MAVTATKIAGSGSTTLGASSSYTLSLTGVSMSADTLYLLHINNADSPAADLPSSVTGRSLTWVRINTGIMKTGISGAEVYRAMGSPAASGDLTVSFGDAQADLSWSLIEVSGADTSGTNGSGAIVQNKQGVNDTFASSCTLTFDSTPDSGNANFGFFNFANDVSASGEEGYTDLDEYLVNSSADYGSFITYLSESGGDTTVYCSIGTSTQINGLALEIQPPAPKPTVLHAVDSFQIKTITNTHSVDALVLKRVSISHSVDSLKLRATNKIHGIDSLIFKRTKITYEVQSYITSGETFYLVVNVQSYIKKTIKLNHSIDAVIAARNIKNHNVDVLRKKTLSVNFSGQSLVRKGYTASHSVDALKALRGTKINSIDSLLKKRLTKNHGVQSYIGADTNSGNGAVIDWVDGFDHQDIVTDIYDVISGNVSIDTGVYRSGNAALKIYPSNSAAYLSLLSMVDSVRSQNVGIRTYVRFDTLPTEDVVLMSMAVNGSVQMKYDSATSTFYLRQQIFVPYQEVSIPEVVVEADKWYLIEIYTNSEETNEAHSYGFAAEVGQPIYSTGYVGSGGQWGYRVVVSDFLFGTSANQTCTMYFDDCVIYSTPDTEANSVGHGHSAALIPASDGTHNVGTNNFYKYSGGSSVAITGSTTDANTYIDAIPFAIDPRIEQRVTAGTEYVEVQFTQLPSNSFVRAVQAFATYAAASDSVNYGKLSMFDGSDTETIIIETGKYSGFYHGFQAFMSARNADRQLVAEPTGGWDSSEVNALYARFGYSSDANPDIYLGGILLQVDVKDGVTTFVEHSADALITGGIPRIYHSIDSLIGPKKLTKQFSVDALVGFFVKTVSSNVTAYVGKDNLSGTEYPWGTKTGNSNGYGFYYGSVHYNVHYSVPYDMDELTPWSVVAENEGGSISDGTYVYRGGWWTAQTSPGVWLEHTEDPTNAPYLPDPFCWWKRYNPDNDTWEDLAIPEDGTGAFMIANGQMCYFNGKIYLFNGQKYRADKTQPQYVYPVATNDRYSRETWIYDIATDSWDQGATMPIGSNLPIGSLPHFRLDGGAGAADNKIYLFGGWGSGSNANRNNRIDCYHIGSDSWTTDLGPLPSAQGGSDYGAAFTNTDGKIWFFGSASLGDYPDWNFTIKWDPDTNTYVFKGNHATLSLSGDPASLGPRTWVPESVFPVPIPGDSNHVFLITGWDYTDNHEIVVKYDLTDGSIQWQADMPFMDPLVDYDSSSPEIARYNPYDEYYQWFGALQWWPAWGATIETPSANYFVVTYPDGTLVWRFTETGLKAGWGILL